MINGLLTLYPKFGDNTFKELKSKNIFRNIPCSTDYGFDIYITIREDIYQKYSNDFLENSWGNEKKFIVCGTIKSLTEVTQNSGLSNLYIKADFIEPYDEPFDINLFSVNAHLTKTSFNEEGTNFYRIAANKSILNKNEKMNKSSTYCYIKTPLEFHAQDIMQGSAKIIQHNNELALEGLHLSMFTGCRELTETFLNKELISVV